MQTSVASSAKNRLTELREERGLIRSQLAGMVPVDQTTLWRWEKGITPIPDHHKLTLAAFFGVSAAYLMGWSVERNGA